MNLPDSRTFRRDELMARGWSGRSIRRAIDRGDLVRLERGIYARSSDGTANRVKAEALLKRLGPDAVVSDLAAAMAHGLPIPEWMMTDVKATRSLGNGTRSYYPCPYAPDEIVEIDGLPTTSLARTAVDVARHVPFQWGVVATDHALKCGATKADMERVLDRWPRRPGNKRAREAVTIADVRSESPGESRSRAIMFRQNMPPPDLQVEIHDEAGRFVARVDFLWEEYGVIGEFDGEAKYSMGDGGEAQAREAERVRQQRLEDLGYLVVRWGWAELSNRGALSIKIDRTLSRGRMRDRQPMFHRGGFTPGAW